MQYSKNWETSKKRYEAFWQGELLDRCCVAVTAPLRPAPPLPDYTPEEVLARWTDGEWLYEKWTTRFANTYFAGDAFPNLWLNLGPSGHAAYCKDARFQMAQQGKGAFSCTAWYTPSIQSWAADFPRFDAQSLMYRKTLELAEYLAGRSKGDFMVSMPDISGNLDALAHLRGSEALLMDMLDDPEEVLRAGQTMQDIWKTTVAEVYKRVAQNNGGASSIGWMQIWAPGVTAQLQCDLSVMLSREMFVQLAMPELRQQCDYLPYPLYHFDGQEQRRHLDALLSLDKLRVIQWTSVDGQPSPVAFLPELRRMQQAGKSLYFVLKPQEVQPIMEGLSSKGLHFAVTAANPQEADDIVRLVERLTHA